MPGSQLGLLPVFALAYWSTIANASTSTQSGTLSCDRAVLGAQSETKWVVSCASEDAAPSAFFNPSLVQNFYVNSGADVAASSSDLNLSSTFSKVDELVSSTITKFSLSAASGFAPTVPVTIAPAAFAELSALEIL